METLQDEPSSWGASSAGKGVLFFFGPKDWALLTFSLTVSSPGFICFINSFQLLSLFRRLVFPFECFWMILSNLPLSILRNFFSTVASKFGLRLPRGSNHLQPLGCFECHGPLHWYFSLWALSNGAHGRPRECRIQTHIWQIPTVILTFTLLSPNWRSPSIFPCLVNFSHMTIFLISFAFDSLDSWSKLGPFYLSWNGLSN